MPSRFSAIPGAQGFQQSNPSVLSTVSLLGSLQVFHEAGGMVPLRERSVKLTSHLEALLERSKFWIPAERAGLLEDKDTSCGHNDQGIGFTIITPKDPAARGSQLSLLFFPSNGAVMPKVMEGLGARGVIGDSRKPDVIRLAPCALYNTMEEVERAVGVLEEVMGEIATVGVGLKKQ
ncbi:hypothetical protein NLI96_g4796 [Meripilus lineatus]|uniref:Aminotransferase class V domain-containing protein n=1 Tax=Meripilus lineatus TaxID=2056292 RepID=A0AAD5YFD6_9APHY|nr:hypothetical protein NLI96_g4796 [Physisporinus lineatus]